MKHFSLLIFAVASLSLFWSCNSSGNTDHDDTDTTMKGPRDTVADNMGRDTSAQPLSAHAQAVLTETQADTVVTGSVTFDTIPGGKVKMKLDVTIPKLANKTVAVHIHEHGDCGDKGMGAHGHWNPGNTQHGKWGTGSFHAGDIGNVQLDGGGKGTLTLETDLWSVGGPNRTNILKRAVIVHSGQDDFTTQPTGNSGSRIACGVIQ